jgi:hypothetical protein
VQVQNLDDAGRVIAGELATAAQIYSFVRPRLDGPGAWYDAAAALQEHLRDLIVENVGMNPGVEYDEDTGDFRNFVGLAHLPGIAVTRVTYPQGDDDSQDDGYLQEAGDPSGHLLQRRAPVVHDMTATLVLVSDSVRELLNLGEILAHVLRHHATFASAPVDPNDITKGTSDLVLVAAGAFGLSDRIGNTDICTADLPVMIKNVLSFDLPGAPTEGLPESPLDMPHEGTRGITMPVERLVLHRAKLVP